MREASVVGPGDGLAGLDGDCGWLEHQGTAVSAELHASIGLGRQGQGQAADANCCHLGDLLQGRGLLGGLGLDLGADSAGTHAQGHCDERFVKNEDNDLDCACVEQGCRKQGPVPIYRLETSRGLLCRGFAYEIVALEAAAPCQVVAPWSIAPFGEACGACGAFQPADSLCMIVLMMDQVTRCMTGITERLEYLLFITETGSGRAWIAS